MSGTPSRAGLDRRENSSRCAVFRLSPVRLARRLPQRGTHLTTALGTPPARCAGEDVARTRRFPASTVACSARLVPGAPLPFGLRPLRVRWAISASHRQRDERLALLCHLLSGGFRRKLSARLKSWSHRLHGLALAVVDEAGQVATGCIALDTSPEAVGKLVGELSEASQDRSRPFLVHAPNRREFASFVQVRNLGSTRTKG